MKPTKQTERLLLAACLTEDDRRMASEWLEIYSPGSEGSDDGRAEDLAHLARRARWATEKRVLAVTR